MSTSSWLRRRVEGALQHGFQHAYETVKVHPRDYLLQLQAGHGLPISSFQGVFSVPIENLDEIAAGSIRAGMKLAAAEGAGLGLFGMLTLVPDLSILAGITMRTIQKLSLIYGFEYNTDEEIADLWVAAASAAGVDVGRELLEKEVVNRVVPRMIRAIALQGGAEISEKLAGRLIPLVSSAIGAGLNFYFVRAWGARAQLHFREKHLRRRQDLRNASAEPQGRQALLGE